MSATIEPPVLGPEVLDELLTRSADVTVLVDASTGAPVRRWYDPERSRLRLPDQPVDRLITWVHPDDLPDVLDVLAAVAHEGVSRTTMARINPERDGYTGCSLMFSVHDVQHVTAFGLLVHVWLVDFDPATLGDVPAESTMSSLAEAAPVGLQVRAANGVVSFENSRFAELAASAHDCIDAHVRDALEHEGEQIDDIEVDQRSLRLRIVPTFDDEGRLLLGVASLEDVTSLRVAEAGRLAAEGLFRAVFDDSPVATAVVDLDGRLVQVNETLAMICGHSAGDLLGRTFADITHPDDLAIDDELFAEVLDGRRGGYQIEKRYLHRAGHEVWVEVTVSTVRDATGAISHLVSHVTDITTRKALLTMGDSAADLAYWATRDHLTGLPNRRHLDGYLSSTIGPRRRAEDHLVVLFFDLDDFKPVNDRYGHQVGDEVLRTIARRLRNLAREDELVARWGGDEFVVVSHRLHTAAEVALLSERILTAVRTPITGLADGPICVGASIGIGIASQGDEPEEVLRRADAAAIRAKRAGKGRVRHQDEAWPRDQYPRRGGGT